MQTAVDRPRFRATVFHDVDFATSGPSNTRKIVTQQPKGWPQAACLWNLDPRFKSSVLLEKMSVGLQACRGIVAHDAVASSELLLDGLDDQVPVLLANVSATVRVIFQLLIAPTASTAFDDPFGRVRCRPRTAVEVVAPGQNPVGFRSRQC